MVVWPERRARDSGNKLPGLSGLQVESAQHRCVLPHSRSWAARVRGAGEALHFFTREHEL